MDSRHPAADDDVDAIAKAPRDTSRSFGATFRRGGALILPRIRTYLLNNDRGKLIPPGIVRGGTFLHLLLPRVTPARAFSSPSALVTRATSSLNVQPRTESTGARSTQPRNRHRSCLSRLKSHTVRDRESSASETEKRVTLAWNEVSPKTPSFSPPRRIAHSRDSSLERRSIRLRVCIKNIFCRCVRKNSAI